MLSTFAFLRRAAVRSEANAVCCAVGRTFLSLLKMLHVGPRVFTCYLASPVCPSLVPHLTILSREQDLCTPSLPHTLSLEATTTNTTMSLLTPPPTTARTSTAEPQRPCALRFLDDHLKHGGLDTNGYDMLHGVLQMFGEISLLLFPPSHRLEAKVMRRIHLLSDRIAGTFHIFGKHIDIQLRRAKRAMRELPDLAVAHEDRHRQNLEVWRRKLR